MANDLSFNQISTVLTGVYQQATGQAAPAVVDTSSFVSVAQTALLTGYDNVLQAISQVLARTIFSIRPYNRIYPGLFVSNQKYGNHIRKLTAIDGNFENDSRQPLTQGDSVDMYEVNKPGVLQTNFYGQEAFEKSITIFRDQLDVAFSGPDEFQQFISMVLQNVDDMIEQAHESMSRMTVNNLIGAVIDGGTNLQSVKLLTMYNTLTGGEFTAQTIYAPQNFQPFVRWAMSEIQNVADIMRNRTSLYHVNITNKVVQRHTPYSMQKLYMFGPFMNRVDSEVLSTTFHDNYLKIADYEKIDFWQNPQSPATINITPSYISAAGAVVKGDAVNKSTVLGVVFDDEAAGINVFNQWSAPTPFNAKGGYSNIFWHFTDRYWNDTTENAAVFLME